MISRLFSLFLSLSFLLIVSKASAQIDFSFLVYDPDKVYAAGSSVIESTSKPGEIYTAKIEVPKGQNGPPNSTYWSSSSEYTTQLTQENSSSLSTVPNSDVVNTSEIANLDTPEDSNESTSVPVFAVGATASVSFQENNTSSVYTASATGANSYSISGGDDASLFTINTATGELSFKATPDYENPSDIGSENSYSVKITATNTVGPSELSLTINVTDDTSDNTDPSSTQNARLVSVNVRGQIGAGNDKRIMAFLLTDTGTVFSRAIGPTLAEYGLPSTSLLQNPQIRLFKYNAIDIFSGSFPVPAGDNNDYSTNSNLSDIEAARNNLIPVVNTNSAQAISLTSLDSGFYTLQVEDEDGVSTGIGTATVDLTDTTSSTAFTHVSARGLVSTGEYMFGGFQIVGTGTRKVFVRGRGPSLGAAGVPNTMVDPKIAVFKYQNDPNDDLQGISSIQLPTNDDYTTDANSSAMLTYSTSLYPNWPALDSTEPGMILTLGPGYYTVQLQSKSATNDGNAWIGVDDVTDR
jgi:hypothetical protein